MPDREELKQAWLRAERDAVAAEQELAAHGQAEASPEFRDKALRAAELRAAADAIFHQLHARLKTPPPG